MALFYNPPQLLYTHTQTQLRTTTVVNNIILKIIKFSLGKALFYQQYLLRIPDELLSTWP